jgi:hypothetical protein
MISEVWQRKELWVHFSDLWQGKDLGTGGDEEELQGDLGRRGGLAASNSKTIIAYRYISSMVTCKCFGF